MRKIIKMNVSTGWANSDHNEEMKVPENWDEWSSDEQENFLNEVSMEFLHECCESSAWVEESEDE